MNQRQPTQPHQGTGMQGDAQRSQSLTASAMIAPQQVPAHLMGLMTNPALAAAAAGSPLFPPAAMLSNPGAFLTMPEAFVNAAAAANNAQQSQHQQNVNSNANQLSRLAAAGMGNFNPGGGDNRQQQHVQQQQAASAPGTMLANVGFPAFAAQNVASVQQQQQHVQIIPPNASGSMTQHNATTSGGSITDDHLARHTDLTPEERARQNRDRNREHARSTRLRKKAYVQKLKELVEGLHAERTEEVRQRRVAIQHLAEMQNVRRGVVRTFLRNHSNFETDERKWDTILEDSFWFKQPVTPYRSFRRTEIEQDCRISRGIEGMIADSASISVMVEGMGSRSTRWMQIKREEFFFLEESKRGPARMPRSIVRHDSRLNHAVSSLSSSSGSSNGSAGEEADKQRIQGKQDLLYAGSKTKADGAGQEDAKKVSSSSGSSSDGHRKQLAAASKDFHDYHAQPLPDPKLGDSGSSSPSEDSPEESNSSANGDGKRMCTDSSSGDDSAAAIAAARPSNKRRKTGRGSNDQDPCRARFAQGDSCLPPNIANTGGITANVLPVGVSGGSAGAGGPMAPAMPLPPFAGLGKRVGAGSNAQGSGGGMGTVSIVRSGVETVVNGGSNIVTADVETSSSNSSQLPQIRAYYHINEDDMILMEDVLMCPYVFRSQDAVVCGALAECVMPGMFRAHFSARNKLLSVEMVYDAMGFMQQLERASGSERTAQIIPGSLEMALSPSSTEARVITLAEPPFLVVNVNEVWTRMTKYTQMEVEGKELLSLMEGERTLPDAGDRPGKPQHKYDEVAKGLCACSTNIHYDKDSREFVDFVCSYPLTNANDEITHLLHICKELPTLSDSLTDN